MKLFGSALTVSALAFSLLLSATGCSAEIAGEEEENVGESGDYLIAGKQYKPAAIADLLREAGAPEAAVSKLVCAAKWESSFYDGSTNKNKNGSTDTGLFQINSIHIGGTRGCPSTRSPLFDAETNVKCAVAIYKMQGINAWYGYRAHRSECDNYTIPGDDGSPTSDTDMPCFSNTLGVRIPEKECVQSRSDSQWYQCVSGRWVRGTSTQGPSGTCTDSHPL